MKRLLSRRLGVLAVLAAVGVLALGLLAACAEAPGLPPTTRTIYMEAIEPEGTTNVAKEPFPTQPLPGGGGYELEEPDEKGDWTVETYIWSAEQIVVSEGDTVNLEILGVNGARHDSYIEGYIDSFVVERGKLTSLSFVADKPGVFKIVCTTHQPSQTAELVVLPR